MIQFENPFAFLLLLLLPVLYVLRWLGLFSKISFPLNLSDWNGENFVWKKGSITFLSVLQRILLCFSYVSTVVAFSNPVIRQQEKISLLSLRLKTWITASPKR